MITREMLETWINSGAPSKFVPVMEMQEMRELCRLALCGLEAQKLVEDLEKLVRPMSPSFFEWAQKPDLIQHLKEDRSYLKHVLEKFKAATEGCL